jgi:hypothetical protein
MVAAYLRERLDLRIFVPLAVVIAAPPMIADPRWTRFIVDGGFAFLLLTQFRTWDDLADREHDAVAGSGRVLVRATDVTQVIAFVAALGVLNICLSVWRDATGIAVGVLAALNGTLGIWYLARTHRSLFGEYLLLAKYPAMVLIVSGDRVLDVPGAVAGLAIALYCAVCAYEVWHDPTSPLSVSFGGRS